MEIKFTDSWWLYMAMVLSLERNMHVQDIHALVEPVGNMNPVYEGLIAHEILAAGLDKVATAALRTVRGAEHRRSKAATPIPRVKEGDWETELRNSIAEALKDTEQCAGLTETLQNLPRILATALDLSGARERGKPLPIVKLWVGGTGDKLKASELDGDKAWSNIGALFAGGGDFAKSDATIVVEIPAMDGVQEKTLVINVQIKASLQSSVMDNAKQRFSCNQAIGISQAMTSAMSDCLEVVPSKVDSGHGGKKKPTTRRGVAHVLKSCGITHDAANTVVINIVHTASDMTAWAPAKGKKADSVPSSPPSGLHVRAMPETGVVVEILLDRSGTREIWSEDLCKVAQELRLDQFVSTSS
jgi:hypothetical protein